MDLIYPKTAVAAVDFNAELQICIASLRKKRTRSSAECMFKD